MAILLPNLDKDQRRLLQELRRSGPLSRSSLAARLETGAAALTRLSRDLLAQDLIEEMAESPEARRGRPAIPLRIAPRGGYAVGATVHKGEFELALVDFSGAIIARHRETSDPLDPQAFARRVRRITYELVDAHDLLGARMLGVGIAVPGPPLEADYERWGVVLDMPGWRAAPLRAILGSELGWPLWIENDANAAAIAEFYTGGYVRECDTLAVILFGYGVGAGVIAGGRLRPGQFGSAGEIGCLFPLSRPRPSPLDLLANLQAAGCAIPSLDAIALADPAQRDVIERWMDRAASQLEIVCNTAFAWLDPGAIVLSGTLPAAILDGLEQRLRAAALVTISDGRGPVVRASRLAGSPITLGAALLPVHALSS
ncbi:ROK family protein [Novosphingobium sp. 1949]|uniref:ROK family protein n=1 Tax=Novosphingobium organovorum TaxID=2930092 RepID=A0ABT0BI09_9SPHN|nr:ROK family transcriptional regulator [Novosphingobium organovorum]MCJ2184682.1 ROK family protein [Novosphingobium organovorum]